MVQHRRSYSESSPHSQKSEAAASGTPRALDARGQPTAVPAHRPPIQAAPCADASSARLNGASTPAPSSDEPSSSGPRVSRASSSNSSASNTSSAAPSTMASVVELDSAPLPARKPVQISNTTFVFVFIGVDPASSEVLGPTQISTRPPEVNRPVPSPSRQQPSPLLQAPADKAPAPEDPARQTPPPPAAREKGSDPSSGLFRRAAVDARRADGAGLELEAGPAPKNWVVLLVLVSLVGLLFAGAALLSIEVTAEAQGTLRAPKGLRTVASVLGGSITEVLVQSGDQVSANQIVVRLEARELRANLQSRQRELEITRRDVTTAAQRDREIEERAAEAMQRRRAALSARIKINSERVAERRAQVTNYDVLVREGGASQAEGLTAKEALSTAAESVSLLSAEVAQLDLEIVSRARDWQERESLRLAQLSRAEAAVQEAQALLASTEIRAPAAGQIESLVVSPGSVVEQGSQLANVVPSGAPRTIVAFIPSREIAFVAPGAAATVEVQSLPVSEFGLAKGRVTRVSSDVATAAEVQTSLGEAAPGSVVRVELELLESEASLRMRPHLRSGERVTVRLHRRQRRLITLLFDFVRRWTA